MKLLYFSAALLLVTVFSCSKDFNEYKKESIGIDIIQVRNGMMVLKNMDQLTEMTKAIQNNTLEPQELYSKFPDFKSVFTGYNELESSGVLENLKSLDELKKYEKFIQINTNDGETYVGPLMADAQKYFVNTDGLLQIGEELFYFEPQQISIFNSRKYDLLKSPNDNKVAALTNEIKINIQLSNKTELESREYGQCTQHWCSSGTNCGTWGFKMVCEIGQRLNLVNHIISYSKINFYKRGFLGIWYNSSQHQGLFQEGYIRTFVTGNPLPITEFFDQSLSGGSNNVLEFTHDWGFLPGNISPTEGNADYEGRFNGSPRFCNVYK